MREKALHPLKKKKKTRESHAHPKKPSNQLELKPKKPQSSPTDTPSLPGCQPQAPSPEHKEPLPPHSWSEVPPAVPTRNWSRIVHLGRTATKKRPNQSLPALDPTKNAQVHSCWGEPTRDLLALSSSNHWESRCRTRVHR